MTMFFTDLQWADAARRFVLASGGASLAMIPADPANTDYQAILASGVAIAEPDAPIVTEDMVREEAHRRIRVLLGAVSTAHAALIVADNEREMRCLAEAGEGKSKRASELRALDSKIEAIWTGYNDVPSPPPADFAAASRWQDIKE